MSINDEYQLTDLQWDQLLQESQIADYPPDFLKELDTLLGIVPKNPPQQQETDCRKTKICKRAGIWKKILVDPPKRPYEVRKKRTRTCPIDPILQADTICRFLSKPTKITTSKPTFKKGTSNKIVSKNKIVATIKMENLDFLQAKEEIKKYGGTIFDEKPKEKVSIFRKRKGGLSNFNVTPLKRKRLVCWNDCIRRIKERLEKYEDANIMMELYNELYRAYTTESLMSDQLSAESKAFLDILSMQVETRTLYGNPILNIKVQSPPQPGMPPNVIIPKAAKYSKTYLKITQPKIIDDMLEDPVVRSFKKCVNSNFFEESCKDPSVQKMYALLQLQTWANRTKNPAEFNYIYSSSLATSKITASKTDTPPNEKFMYPRVSNQIMEIEKINYPRVSRPVIAKERNYRVPPRRSNEPSLEYTKVSPKIKDLDYYIVQLD